MDFLIVQSAKHEGNYKKKLHHKENTFNIQLQKSCLFISFSLVFGSVYFKYQVLHAIHNVNQKFFIRKIQGFVHLIKVIYLIRVVYITRVINLSFITRVLLLSSVQIKILHANFFIDFKQILFLGVERSSISLCRRSEQAQ